MMDSQAAIERSLVQRVNVGDLITRSAARTPDKEAIVDGSLRLTYSELEAWSNQVAHALGKLGYEPGDRLGLMSPNRAEFLVTYFACAKAGVVCVPINLLWRHGELAYVIEHSRVQGIVVTSEHVEQLCTGLATTQFVRDIFIIGPGPTTSICFDKITIRSYEELRRDMPTSVPSVLVEDRAPLTYLYTSGTTSAPKGVVGSHLSVYLESLGTAIDTKMAPEDRAVAMLPLFHTAQLNAICTPVFAVGGTVCILRGFDAQSLLDVIEAERLTVLFGLPMMYRSLLEAQRARPRCVSNLRLAVYAMAPMPDQDLKAAIETFGCGFSLMFGQTEMSPVATFFRPEHQLSHAGAVGTPATNVHVGIMSESGELLPWGQTGEIVYRSPQVLTEYLRNDDATAEVFRNGWFHSGDLGVFDTDGLLWFKDRVKDVIKTGGENVSSQEVEKAIYAYSPDVAEAVVVGIPHERWTEAITAVIVLREGSTINERQLMDQLRGVLSPFKCPKAVIVADTLPKTATGKVQKALVRKQYMDHYRRDVDDK